jgi:ZIP family zinc transporter
VLAALLVGALGSSALVLGGALGSAWRAPTKVTGVLLAFASGSLIAALAFELFPEAVEVGGLARSATGLAAGGATFVVLNTWLDARVAKGAGDAEESPLPDDAADTLAGAEADQREKLQAAARRASSGAGLATAFALLAAVTLDGVPENLALGVSLIGSEDEGIGGSVALLVAIFVSNLPESLVGAVAMSAGGLAARTVIGIWSVTAVVLTAAVVLGYAALSSVSEEVLAFPLAFAGGAVLASLADTLMPEAFEHGRPLNSFATGAGFFLSFVLAEL